MTNASMRAGLAPLLVAGGIATFGCAMPERPSALTVDSHVAAAHAAARDDLKPLLALCTPAAAVQPPHDEVEKYIATQIAKPAPPSGKAFDNLYFVGAAWVSAWALKTSEGLILIDALNNSAEASTVLENGMRRQGLDPAQIRYVIVTHGHGDHYGGVRYLLERYKPRIVMSELDWRMTETQLDFESAQWDPPPKRDISVGEGDTITLGDTTVTIRMTPGHTVGTLSPAFDVTSGGETHRVVIWGGTSFNFGRNIERLDSYIASTRHLSAIVEQEKIDVLLSNHSGYDDSLPKLQRLRDAPAVQPNPFVMGVPTVRRALTVMEECARAQRDRYLL